MHKPILAFVFSLLFIATHAQPPSEVLLTINDQDYSVEDFERVYTKNLDLLKDEEQKDLDNYIDLYVLYQLKVQKAYALKLHEKESYKQELAKHRQELAEKYFTDEDRLDDLVKEAFERSSFEREAAHILIRVDEYATPQDTLAAYEKAMNVYQKAKSGESFEELAATYSEDPSAKQNKGYLGSFSIFRMVYPFESAAFETPVGEISRPVRSRFGYHIVHVIDEKPVRYYRSISIIKVNQDDFADAQQAKEAIDKAYAQLQKGQSMQAVAEKMVFGSTDNFKTIEKFYPGLMRVAGLEDQVYSMNEGDFSTPIADKNSWYIVQLNKILPTPTYEESYANLRRRVISDSRAQVLKKDLKRHLSEKYHFTTHPKALQKVFDLYNNKKHNTQTDFPTLKNPQEIVASFDGKKINAGEWAEYLNNRLKLKAEFMVSETFLAKQWDEFVVSELKQKHDENLENIYPDFKHTMQEYREGLLLFDLMEQEIWKKAKQDTLAQQQYFAAHLDNYKEPAKIDGALLFYDTENTAQKAMKFYQKSDSYEQTVAEYVPENWYKGELSADDERLQNSKSLEKSTQVYPVKGKYALLIVKNHLPAQVPEWDAVKNKVAYDYQTQFENEWNQSLRDEAKVIINQSAFEKIKAKYQQ